MKESELLTFCLQTLKKSGLVYWRVPNGPVMHNLGGKLIRKCSPIRGFPDVAGVMPNGRFFAIELKTETGKLSPEQAQWIAALNHSKATAVILRTKDEIADFVACASQVRQLLD